MTENRKALVSNLLISTVSVGILYLVFKNRTKIFQTIRVLSDIRNPLRHQKIEIIENVDDCHNVVKKLKSHCDEYRVLGLDCEWVTVGGTRRPVALLQLASHRGLCALFRLCCLQNIPKSLRELLEDENILKVGVAIQDDAMILARDYGVGVASTLDLRYLTRLAGRKPEGLGKLSKSVLNVELDKNWRIRCSDWEAAALSDKQEQYAAKDALVAVEIFKRLSKEIKTRSLWQSKNQFWQEILGLCEPFIDRKFYNNAASMSKNSESSCRNGYSKKFNRSICTRSKRLYDNCFLEAPDGELLCTCDKKKSIWYIAQGLGELVSENPFTVRLKFEPAGRAVGEVGKYYTLAKENQCVVCGRRDAYIRKNVVPREYRRHFPVVMKSHTSHDVLLLCPECHQLSNKSDLKIREQLDIKCNAPFTGEGGKKFVEIPKLKKLRSAARALLYNADKIPPEKQAQLKEVIHEYYPDVEITKEILTKAATVNVLESVDNYCSHGEKVVSEFKEKFGGLVELEKIWREHFLKTMRPKHLPNLWSVTHNAHRLEIRASEGRIEKNDMAVAGLDPKTLTS